jgi:hypothetical protein
MKMVALLSSETSVSYETAWSRRFRVRVTVVQDFLLSRRPDWPLQRGRLTSYTMCSPSMGVNRPGREADHLPSTSAGV